MPRKSERKTPGVTVTQHHAAATDRCNFHGEDSESACDRSAVTALIVTNANGHGVLLKLCRRHLCGLSILLIAELE
jgi:hypothetical protein